MSAKPALPTSSVVNPIDVSFTDKATHVYVKVENPTGLSGRFEGPYEITSRPSRSQVQLRIGSYANGTPRLQTYSWQSCKIAHLRPDQPEASRPALGRKPKSSSKGAPSSTTTTSKTSRSSSSEASSSSHQDTLSGNRPHPGYLQKGPLITNKMFDDADWPSILNIKSSRPARSTRNPNPQYVDAIRGV